MLGVHRVHFGVARKLAAPGDGERVLD